MSELFSIQLQNRQQQGRDGVWLDLPTTTEQVQAALRQIGISSDNPQGLFISGYFAEEEKRFAIPYNMVLASNVDELNFLAARLETLSAGERAELNAALQAPQSELSSIGRITDFPENVDYYVHLPDVHGPAQLGDYYLNRSGMVDMPDEWKGGIDTAQFGRYVAQQEQGLPSMATLSKAGMRGRKSTRASLCRRNTGYCPFLRRKFCKIQPTSRRLFSLKRNRRKLFPLS